MATTRRFLNRLFWIVLAAWAINFFIIESETASEILGPLLVLVSACSLVISIFWKAPKDNPFEISDAKYKQIESEQPNLKTWNTTFDGREIKVTNWHSLKNSVGGCALLINGKMKAQSQALVTKPKEPALETGKDDGSGLHVQVFFAGLFTIKTAIAINGAFVLREELSLLDRLARGNFPESQDPS